MKLFSKEKKQEEEEILEVHNEAEEQKEQESQKEQDSKEERLKRIAMQRIIVKEQFEELSIAQAIHVIKYLEVFQKASPLENYEDNHTVVFQIILEKIKEAPVLYILFDEKTGLPFVANGFIELFSNKEFAKQAVAHYAETFRKLEVREILKESTTWLDGINVFAYLYYLGMEDLLIDNGQQALAFKRQEILEAPDWSGMEEKDRPVINGELRFWMNVYLEEVRWEVTYEGHEERVSQLEEEMVKRLKTARYLVPVITSEETGKPVQIATLPNNKKEMYLPMFTDWFEFDKVFNQEQWKGMAFTFKQGIEFGQKCDGVVINPLGENIMMSKEIMKKRFPEFISAE
ncbi:MAG: SseB family protein [bacterium]|nr:SseB family protein [bacterium]